MSEQNNVTNSLAHTKWNCKYHVVFAQKYRRKVFFNEKRAEIRDIIRTVPMKGCRGHRGRSVSRPHSFTIEYPIQNERFGIYGIFEGKKQSDDIPEIRKYEIRIPKPRILV